MTTMRWGAVLIALAWGASASAATATSNRSTTAPTTNPMILDAQRLIRAGRVVEIATKVEWPLQQQLKDFARANSDEVIRLVTLRAFGRFFARVSEPDQGTVETLSWLIAQPKLAPALMMTCSPFDPPDRVLEVLRALRADHRTKLDEFADLAAAMCVVWDAPERFGGQEDTKIDPEEVARVFGYFVKAPDRLALDPRRMPGALLVHVVDLELNDDELAWVSARRGGGGVDVPAAFAAVKYWEGADYDRARKEPIDDQAYVLPNILNRGGNGGDIAYFASQIARCAGVPAIVSKATDADGPPVAWVGFLRTGAAPTWDFSSARYRDDLGWPGQIVDPQTGEALREADVAILAGLMTTPQRDRLMSTALCQSLDLVPADQRILLLRRAIELSPANRSAWFALADLAAKEKFDDAAMKPMEEVIAKYLKRSPDFATSLRLRTLKGRGSAEFEHLAKRAAEAVADRPELVATMRLALADRLREDKRLADALATLTDLLRQQIGRSPAMVWSAMTRVDAILRQQEQIEKLAAMYHDALEALPRPDPSRHGRATPYYRVGAKYADVLDELKQPQEAAAVRVKISNIVQE